MRDTGRISRRALFAGAGAVGASAVLAACGSNRARSTSGAATTGTATSAAAAGTASATPTPTPTALGASGVNDPASLTFVVNKARSMPADYVPKNLVTPKLPNNNGQPIRKEMSDALDELAAAAKSEAGQAIIIASGYRSYPEQQRIYNGIVASKGQAHADEYSARPGHSEHQTGLAADVGISSQQCTLDPCFGNLPAGKWLAENAWRFGLLLRYPADLRKVVGYSYEPWHFRFVGKDVMADMHKRGIRTLEQYYGLPDAPDYVK